MDFSNFKYMLGETLVYCQTIEHYTKLIYSSMLRGDLNDNFDIVSGWTFGQVVNELEQLDFSDNDNFLTKGDYELLKQIKDESNYLVHKICCDFLYIENWAYSSEYRKACERLENLHNRLSKLQDSVEKVRLKAVKKYRG